MASKRNGKIDFLRFLFSLIIVIHHSRYLFGDDNCLFLGGSFAVEFFFLVSGYLMMASIENRARQSSDLSSLGKESLGFVWNKAKSLYPEVLIAWVIAVIFVAYARQKSLLGTAALFIDTFFETTFLKMSGVSDTALNGVVWYVSSMLLCMLALYPLIRKFPDMMIHVVLPLVVLLGLGYLCSEYGEPRNPTLWIGFTFKGNIRALSEISLGVLCYRAVQRLSGIELRKLGKILLSLCEWALYGILILYMYFAEPSDRDSFFILVMAVAVSISFSQKGIDTKLFNNGFFRWLGRCSLPIYLGHTYYAHNLNRILPEEMDDLPRMGIYLGCTFATSVLIWGISLLIRKALPKLTAFAKRTLIAS